MADARGKAQFLITMNPREQTLDFSLIDYEEKLQTVSFTNDRVSVWFHRIIIIARISHIANSIYLTIFLLFFTIYFNCRYAKFYLSSQEQVIKIMFLYGRKYIFTTALHSVSCLELSIVSQYRYHLRSLCIVSFIERMAHRSVEKCDIAGISDG